ncbi:hypothetical protein G7054_g12517 [Neopestalotiopsis clavispora]|nr:hypothetical protein G7054_g12517 [Neopestalotiopsis clavispora]
MIKDPFGPLWQDDRVMDKLRQLLYRDYTVFEATIGEMSTAIDEIKKKIGLGPDGQVNVGEATLWKLESKRLYFTFNINDYADLLCTLREGNECLENLIRHNKDLEPKRKKRFQTREISLRRLVSQNVFQALQHSIACTCDHVIGLELCQAKIHGEPREHDHEIVSQFEFRVGISGVKPSWNVWKEMLLVPSTVIQDSQLESISSIPSLVSQDPSKGQKSFWRPFRNKSSNLVRSEQDATCTETHHVQSISLQSPDTTPIKIASTQANQIEDLCSTILESNEQTSSFHGSISTYQPADFTDFDIHTATASDGKTCDLVTLDQLLRQNDNSSIQLSYTQKIRLVYLVSNAVLQLPEKSWWTEASLSRDIVFIQKQGLVDYQRVFIGREAVADISPLPLISSELVARPRRPVRNSALLALAIVLVEIMLAKPFEELRAETTPWNAVAIPDARSDLEAVQKLAHRVHNEFGSALGSAIRRCVTGDFDCATISLEDEEFRHEFHVGVVALLGDNMKYAGLA